MKMDMSSDSLIPFLSHLRAHELVNADARAPIADDGQPRPRRSRVSVSITTSGGIVSEVRSSEAIDVSILDIDDLEGSDAQRERRAELARSQERHVELPVQAW